MSTEKTQRHGKETAAIRSADIARAKLLEGKDDSIDLVRELLKEERLAHAETRGALDETRDRNAKERRLWMAAVLTLSGISAGSIYSLF